MNELVTTKLRSHIRNKILSEREELRKNKIEKLIAETKQYTTHEFTGINVLQDLLKQVVPILEKEYKKLTTSEIQRKSFRAHILRGIQNLLATPEVYFNVAKNKKAGMGANKPAKPGIPAQNGVPADGNLEEGEDGELNEAPKDPSFIDIQEPQKQQPQAKPEDAFEPLPQQDVTGRNFALQAFQKIQKQILEEYSMLDSDEDRNMFFEYLLTNLNLYFDRFEDEISVDPASPTTPEYEQQKQKMNSMTAQQQQIAPMKAGE